jgi:hypothetical protein
VQAYDARVLQDRWTAQHKDKDEVKRLKEIVKPFWKNGPSDRKFRKMGYEDRMLLLQGDPRVMEQVVELGMRKRITERMGVPVASRRGKEKQARDKEQDDTDSSLDHYI